MGSMRVAVYYSNTDIRLKDSLKPAIGPDEALIRIEASGICGTDVMEWYRKDKVPLVLGHEVAGTVARVGRKVKDFKAGDRVVATHHVPCGRCPWCRNGHPTVCETLRKTHFDPGGFSEFVRLSALHLKSGTFRIPAGLSFEEGTFVEPLGCVVRGQRLAGMKRGKSVLVVGSGLSGLLHIKLAHHLKARIIMATDVDRYRLGMAEKFGAVTGIDAGEDVPSLVRKINEGRLADVVILCAGSQAALKQGLISVERGGTVLIFTAAPQDSFLPVTTNEIFWRREVTILSSYAAAPNDLKEALRLISQRKILVKDMITHRLPLKEIRKGFELVVRPQNSMKVIIEPHR